MIKLDNLDKLFIVWAFFFQIALIVHFALRKSFFESYTLRYGWIIYALCIPALIISIILLPADMSTGNYVSPGFMTDDNSDRMGEFFGAQPYAARIAAAFTAPHQADPGMRWVYRTSDTFILTRAMYNYLQTRQGPESDIFELVVEDVYCPLKLEPGAYSTMRTADNNWQGQSEGGYGMWWIPDDIAKIAMLLNNHGKIDGVQVLHPALLTVAMQQNPTDRGVGIDGQRMYNNAFWANHYTLSNGYACEFWVPNMLGVSGNVVVLFPNGITYYYFSDNQESHGMPICANRTSSFSSVRSSHETKFMPPHR